MIKRQRWSHSLDRAVRTCQRRVFLTSRRYASQSAAVGSPRHDAFLLKQALDIPNWRGRIVDLTITDKIIPALGRGKWPDFDEAREFALEIVARQTQFSKEGRFRTTSKSKAGIDYCVLRADLEGGGAASADIEVVKGQVALALTVLEKQHLGLLNRIRKAKWLRQENEPIRFNLDAEILVEAKADLIFFQPPAETVIVDWKAVESTHTNARDQLLVYAFAAVHCGFWPGLRVDNLKLIEANLMSGEAIHYSATDEDLDLVDQRIFSGAELLRSVFESPARDCVPSDFPPAESPMVCRYCSVREVCSGSQVRKIPEAQRVLFEFV